MKKYLFVFCLLFLMITPFLIPLAVQAQEYKCSGEECYKLNNPLGEATNSPEALIGKIINSVLGVVGSLALLMFVYGGLTWMTSAGNQEKVKKGRDILMWSAIGLVIIFSSYGLVRVLVTEVQK